MFGLLTLAGLRGIVVSFLLLLKWCDTPPEPKREPASIRLSETAVTVDDGRTVLLRATIYDQRGEILSSPPAGSSLQWSSSNAAVASVDGGGLVSGNRPGQAQVTATVLPQNVSASAMVTVRQVATALQLSGGNDQHGTAGGPLAQQLAVRVVDRHGEGAGNVQVEFSVLIGERIVTFICSCPGPRRLAEDRGKGSPSTLSRSVRLRVG